MYFGRLSVFTRNYANEDVEHNLLKFKGLHCEDLRFVPYSTVVQDIFMSVKFQSAFQKKRDRLNNAIRFQTRTVVTFYQFIR